MIETTRVESGEQVRPQMKWVVLGVKQGSEEKSQLPRQEDGRIVDGSMAALNDLRAAMSAGEVAERENGR